jgi:DNA-binding YbaB/EbfC family protein
MDSSSEAGPMGGDLLERLKRMQEELESAQQKLAEETIEASAGGGGVKVVMTGTQVCQSVVIEPALLAAGDASMLQDLLVLAVNQAIRDSQLLAARRLSPLTGALGGGSGQ